MKTLKIGLFGFGTVGQGFYDILQLHKSTLFQVSKIGIKELNKPRKAPAYLFTNRKEDLLKDPSLDIIVEAIDQAEEAFDIVKSSLEAGIPVVSANKKMIAKYFTELKLIRQETEGTLLYEASTCGAIPIIRNLEQTFCFEQINSLQGIFNGTTNYILTKQYNEGRSFTEILEEAQIKGFAESDPSADVDGFDAKYKLKILLAHVYGIDVPENEILHLGIRSISNADIDYGRNRDCKIKLMAVARKQDNKVSALVVPMFVSKNHPAFHVDQADNFVLLDGQLSGTHLFQGQGAGGLPTGSAVYTDVLAVAKGFKYQLQNGSLISFTNEVLAEVFVSTFSAEKALNAITFEKEYQTFQSPGYHYRTGVIKLSELVDLPANIFCCLLNEHISFPEAICEAKQVTALF